MRRMVVRKVEFAFILASFVLVGLAIGAGISSVAKSMAAEISAPLTPMVVADGIPPNCLLDPWTHKYVCVKWPEPAPRPLVRATVLG